MEEHLDTGIFGAIVVVSEDSRVVVAGDEIPTVELVNTGTQRRPEIPIGTRSGDDLRLTVDGRVCPVRPGPGRYRRSSYRVLVEAPGGPLLFTPSNGDSHRLVRGDRLRLTHELGFFTRHDEATVTVEWSAELALTPTPLRPEPEEAAIGYTLALAFGTGARFFFAALLHGLETLP